MLSIALYSNDSAFLSDFYRGLTAALEAAAGASCRVRRVPIQQTTLFDGGEEPDDLCIVDICDDPERGLEFAKTLGPGSRCEVMLVAPGPELAMAAYDADILAYFTAPADPARAARIVLRRFAQRLHPPGGQVSFPTDGGIQVLPVQRIVFLEYDDHRLILHDDRGRRQITRTMRASFGQIAAQLQADSRFVRTHAAFIVNIQHVERVERQRMVMDTGDRVPIAHGRRRAVRERFSAFFWQP